MAALVPDMFCNFYIVKNHIIAHNTTNTDAREKINLDLEYLEFFDAGLTIFIKYYFNIISQQFIGTTIKF